MQGTNSSFVNVNSGHHQIPSSFHEQIQHSQTNNNQLNNPSSNFDDPTNSSHDDFLEQMLSSLNHPSSCSLWDPHNHNPLNATTDHPINNPSDLPNETTPSKAAVALMLQQQLLISGGGGADSAGLLHQMPLSLGGGEFDRSRNDVVEGSSFKSPNPASVQALFNGFTGSLHGTGQPLNPTQHFQHPQGGPNPMQGQNFGASGSGTGATNQATASGAAGGNTAQPKQRVRARRGQATDPHSIAERLRRERIAERMKALQELVPNANKTDKASMLDEIIDYVKFLQLQVKVLSMSRLGGAAAIAPLVADVASEGGGDCIQANGGSRQRNSNGNQTAASSDESLTMTEHQAAKLMEEDMGSAMQYLQGKGLCLMPISLATAISTATCQTRNPLINGAGGNNNSSGNSNLNPIVGSNGEGPSSPSMSVLTVQSATAANGVASVKDAASVSKP